MEYPLEVTKIFKASLQKNCKIVAAMLFVLIAVLHFSPYAYSVEFKHRFGGASGPILGHFGGSGEQSDMTGTCSEAPFYSLETSFDSFGVLFGVKKIILSMTTLKELSGRKIQYNLSALTMLIGVSFSFSESLHLEPYYQTGSGDAEFKYLFVNESGQIHNGTGKISALVIPIYWEFSKSFYLGAQYVGFKGGSVVTSEDGSVGEIDLAHGLQLSIGGYY